MADEDVDEPGEHAHRRNLGTRVSLTSGRGWIMRRFQALAAAYQSDDLGDASAHKD